MLMVALLTAALVAYGAPAAGQVSATESCCTPCIDLLKTGPDTARPGDVITYAFTVKNCGNVLLGSGAFVYDQLFQTDPIWSGNLDPGQIVTFYREYTVPMDKCGDLMNIAVAIGIPDETNPDCAGIPDATDSDSHSVTVDCDGESPGTGTPGYWKNHPRAWPVDSIMIGGVTYSMEEAITVMWTAGKGDKTFTMFRALAAAKLNVLIGNDSSCISTTIASADSWMALYGPAGSGVGGSSHAWSIGEPLKHLLDAYNNGQLCAPHRD